MQRSTPLPRRLQLGVSTSDGCSKLRRTNSQALVQADVFAVTSVDALRRLDRACGRGPRWRGPSRRSRALRARRRPRAALVDVRCRRDRRRDAEIGEEAPHPPVEQVEAAERRPFLRGWAWCTSLPGPTVSAPRAVRPHRSGCRSRFGELLNGERVGLNWPLPSGFSAISPRASSTYSTTTTPASAHRCRYQSMWHWESDATSDCSGGAETPGAAANRGVSRRVFFR